MGKFDYNNVLRLWKDKNIIIFFFFSMIVILSLNSVSNVVFNVENELNVENWKID